MHCTILKYNALPKCIECCGQASALGTSEKNGFKRADNHHNMDSIIPSNIIATIMCFRISSNSNRYTLIAMYVGGPKHTVDSQRSQWKQTIKTCWCTFCKNNSCQKHNLCAFHTKSCLETDFSRKEIHEVIMNITSIHRLGRIIIRLATRHRYFESWPCRDIWNHFLQLLLLAFCVLPEQDDTRVNF